MSDWKATRAAFCKLAAKRGVRFVAMHVPVHRSAVYRILRGDTTMPQQAVRAGIERLVAEQKAAEKPCQP